MSSKKDVMSAGEIRDRLIDLKRGEEIRVVVDGSEYLGTVDGVHGNISAGVDYNIYVDSDMALDFKLQADVMPAEPNVGIPRPYLEDSGVPRFVQDGQSRGLIDALQVWREDREKWV